MNSFEKKLAQKRQSGKKIFCAYVTLGFPSLAFTRKLVRKLEEAGVDILELGIPFSDPMADGPVIQDASYQALKNNVRVRDAFTLVAELRKEGVTIPIVFFSYYNIIHAMGAERFVRRIAASGFDGVLCPDLPHEEGEGLAQMLSREGKSMVQLIAPTSSPSRIKAIASSSRGFIYYVSRRGVTGVQKSLDATIQDNVRAIKKHSSLNVLVGFGVSTADQVRRVARVSDGVIVGSAIIKEIARTRDVEKTVRFITKLAKGCGRGRK